MGKKEKRKRILCIFLQKKGYWLNLFTQLSHTKKKLFNI